MPLIAMVPVNLRAANDNSTGGNLGTIPVQPATDLDDPAERPKPSTRRWGNKEVFSQLPKLQQLALSAFNVAPMALTLVPALEPPHRHRSISSSPMCRALANLYWNGGKAERQLPDVPSRRGSGASTSRSPTTRTISTSVWSGVAAAFPHLQRLPPPEDSLSSLEKAVGV